jgi:thioredoxin 1
MNEKEITNDNYSEEISKITGLLLSYKPACPHCKNMKIVIGKFKKKQGPVDYLQLDTEANPEAMKALEIERVPTLFIIKDGQIREKKAGLMNPRELAAMYNKAVSN